MTAATCTGTLIAVITFNLLVGSIAVASTDHALLIGRRNQVTDACAQESIGLVGQRTLQDAAEKVETECQPSSAGSSITYDYDGCSTTSEFSAACTSIGGKMLYYDVDMSCSQSGSSAVSLRATNVPECVGASCGLDSLSSKNDKIFGKIESQLNDAGFTCSISSGSNVPAQEETLPEAVPAPVPEPMPSPTVIEQESVPTSDESSGTSVQTEKPTDELVITLNTDDTSGSMAFSPTFVLLGISSVFISIVQI
mmetsp:Transcript_34441/g.75379  ORF Transcript_34441/g.75379 Transcript_34441/m.75379 type:complete len:253 (-) Transcript_34441:113-871(-)|eukprot:CAMPEP_0178512356 /NCGR_PEP_ID=MMETSP0696-20121128/22847_1 /TAXON_ID=265572 /ORGANISM="Extubocellulus spinifer, Strain CCMP396" /LENGTH=252 /DNA_ID=CAMNT_0020142181 /DNA_START=137 /DNA_END=895 /DNA_ORIENTATION=-